MENFEEINSASMSPEKKQEEVFIPEKETQLNSENLAKEGEIRQEMNTKEGNERFLLKYEEALDKIEKEELHFLNNNWR